MRTRIVILKRHDVYTLLQSSFLEFSRSYVAYEDNLAHTLHVVTVRHVVYEPYRY